MLCTNTEILCVKIVSQNHIAARDFKAGKAPCLQDSWGHTPQAVTAPETSLVPLNHAHIQSYFTVRKGDVGTSAPRNAQAVCHSTVATVAGYRRPVEAAQMPAHLLCAEAPGLAGAGEEWKPAPSSCSPFFSAFFSVVASPRHNQIGNLHPSFLLHLPPCSSPTGA